MIIDKTKQAFNQGILNIIDLMKYPVYIIKKDPNIKCICNKTGTSQSDPKCPKCLGLGYKITIQEVEVACNETDSPSTMRNATAFVTSRNYYIPSNITLTNDDIIVDNNEPWFVIQSSEYKSFNGESVYSKYSCMNKKLDSNIFIKNFNKIIGS